MRPPGASAAGPSRPCWRRSLSRANRPREGFALKHRPPSADIQRVGQHLPNRHHPRQGHPRREAGPQSHGTSSGSRPGHRRRLGSMPPRYGVITWVSSTGTAASGRCRGGTLSGVRRLVDRHSGGMQTVWTVLLVQDGTCIRARSHHERDPSVSPALWTRSCTRPDGSVGGSLIAQRIRGDQDASGSPTPASQTRRRCGTRRACELDPLNRDDLPRIEDPLGFVLWQLDQLALLERRLDQFHDLVESEACLDGIVEAGEAETSPRSAPPPGRRRSARSPRRAP